MENANLVGAILGPFYLVIGLSILFYVEQWLKMLKEWHKDHKVLIIGGMISLILGLIVVNMYNVWTWNVWLIVTVSGWMMVLKGVFYFLAPEEWIKAVLQMKTSVNWLYFWSLAMIVAGAALGYYVYLL